jgi:hypothetical protein
MKPPPPANFRTSLASGLAKATDQSHSLTLSLGLAINFILKPSFLVRSIFHQARDWWVFIY